MNRDVASATVACVLLAAMTMWFDVIRLPYLAALMGMLALAATVWLVTAQLPRWSTAAREAGALRDPGSRVVEFVRPKTLHHAAVQRRCQAQACAASGVALAGLLVGLWHLAT